MVTKVNPRAIGGGAGELIGQALAPRELHAVATAVSTAAKGNSDARERMALKRAFANLHRAANWQAKHVKSRGL